MSTATRTNHEIDYLIRGEEMQCVEIELDPSETAIAEAGGFMMMDEGIQMETIFGDGRGQEKGFFGKLMSAGKRVLTGESLFMTAFTNTGQGKKKVLFASPYPGKNHSDGSAAAWRKNDLSERCFSLRCKRSGCWY